MALQARPEVVREREPRVSAQPFEFACSIMFINAGVATARVLTQLDDVYPRVGLLALPVPLLWGWVVAATVGGLLIAGGLAYGFTKRLGRAAESAGLWLAGTSWASVAIVQAFLAPGSPQLWLQYVAITLGCGLRLRSLRRVEHAYDRVARSQESDG